MTSRRKLSCHLICKVIDFFGDIGIAWRIAKQLSYDFNIDVHLLVDNLTTAQKLIPLIDLALKEQKIDDISIHHCDFSEDSKSLPMPAPLILNLFNIDLPYDYKIEIKNERCKYIVIEYLSAEEWVDNFHLKPSVDPKTNVTKTFLYPGFTRNTGGLIREKNLLSRRNRFSENQRIKLIELLGGDPRMYSISLFYYPTQKIEDFFVSLEKMEKHAQIFIPQYLSDLLNFKKDYQFIHIIPYKFLSQDVFDELLWSCNLNFVRGEDSWIRAIWAGKPFVWQPYIQEKNIHLIKLKAFLKRYCETCDKDLSEVLIDMHEDWSSNKFHKDLWSKFFRHQLRLEAFAFNRSDYFFKEASFVQSLIDYCSET